MPGRWPLRSIRRAPLRPTRAGRRRINQSEGQRGAPLGRAEPDTPLLYVLRNDLELNGAKFGCGLAQCGACTVLVDGAAVRSCVTPVGSIEGSEVDHARRARHARQAAPAAAGLHRRAGGAVRLLHQRHDHGGARRCSTAIRSRSEARRARRRSPAISAAAAPTTASSAPCCAPRNEREDADHERSRLTRRDFTAAPRRHRRSPSASCRPSCSAQQPAAAARQPATPTACSTPGCASMPTARVTVFTGKVELGQGILTALAQIAAEELDVPLARVTMISGDTARTPERRADRRQPVDREQRHRAAHGRRRGARDPARPGGQRSSASPPTSLTVADGVVTRRTAARSRYWRARRASATSSAKRPRKVQPKPAAQHKIVGKSIAAPRHPGEGHRRRGLRAGHAAARHGARPRGAAAALRRQARQLSTKPAVTAHAGRRRGGARRQLPRRGRRARGAGDQGARCAGRASRSGRAAPSCRIPAKHVRAAHGAADARTR